MDTNSCIALQNISYTYPETERPVFADLSLELPHGMTSFVGQNGTGKSTLLLLSGGRILPDRGEVVLEGENTRELQDETEKNRYASFIYQNMEFETDEPIGNLLEYVYENGFYEKKDTQFKKKVIEVMELGDALDKKTQELSKGQLQRTIIAFSLLYGSKTIMMDEPIFALEDYQKQAVMSFLVDHARELGISIFYSAHELEITKKYSENIVLFYKDGSIKIGKTKDLFQPDILEKVYEIPYHMLKLKESVYRKDLADIAKYARSKLGEIDDGIVPS